MSDADEELDLRVYVSVLRRRWRIIAGVTLVLVVLAAVASFVQQPLYKVDAEVLIRQSDTILPSGASQSTSESDAARQLTNEVRLFESGVVLDAVRRAYHGPLDPLDVHASASTDSSDVVQVALTGPDAKQAAQLVDLYIGTFLKVRRQLRTDQLLTTGAEIQSKVDDLSAQITKVRKPLTVLEDLAAAAPSNDVIAQRRDALAAQLDPQLVSLENRRSFYSEQIQNLEITAKIAGSSSATVLTDAASRDGKVAPKPARNLAIALFLGLVLGVALAFVSDALDDRLRGPADVDRVSGGLPILAMIPIRDGGAARGFIAARDDLHGQQAEAFRSLRTSVKFTALDRPSKVIQVTSPSQSEGKTTVVANLAVAFAQAGDRVAVVCCDLRRPRVHEHFDEPMVPGLTDVLVSERSLADTVRRTSTGVTLLTAGSPPPNPSELLGSERARGLLRAFVDQFDVVLIDSPPVLPVTDALLVSQIVDGTIVVVDARSTHRKSLRRTLQVLRQIDARMLGVVLNGMPVEKGYGYAYTDLDQVVTRVPEPVDRPLANVPTVDS